MKTQALIDAINKYAKQLDDASDADELEALRDALQEVVEDLEEKIDNYADDEE